MQKAYIAAVEKILPEIYSHDEIADKLYPASIYDEQVQKAAHTVLKAINVPKKPVVFDLEKIPKIELKEQKFHPKNWGKGVVDLLTKEVSKNEVGCFTLAYNLSFHKDTLPNLASQIVMAAKLENIEKCEEIANYGCAAGIYGIDIAYEYCIKHNRPAIAFVFDQCSVAAKQLSIDNPNFRRQMTSNLLFTDGSVGVLIVPESYKERFHRPLLEIKNIKKIYSPGNLVEMTDGNFLMKDELKDVMPSLVSDKLVKPFLQENNLIKDDIKEWSIHQGGPKVIIRFCDEDCLGLSPEIIKPSVEMFYRYGNCSAPSCLLVLEHWFNNKEKVEGENDNHLVIGYGAGYYLGAILATWVI